MRSDGGKNYGGADNECRSYCGIKNEREWID